MISDFRKELLTAIENCDFDRFYDFMPAEMRENETFIVGDILDKANDVNHGITELLFTRNCQVFALVKIKNNKRAVAESRADILAGTVLNALAETTWSWNLQQRKSVGYGIGQYQYQGIELMLEFYQND